MKKTLLYFTLTAILGFILGMTQTEATIDRLTKLAGNRTFNVYQGWSTHLDLARDDQGAMKRAVVARVGLGANTKEEAIYLSRSIDENGEALHSSNDYVVSVPENFPVEAFWSLTLYGADDYLIDNAYDKYAVASFQEIAIRKQGVEIYLSKNPHKISTNWIPLPQEDQNLTLLFRCYHPQKELLEKLDNTPLPTIKTIARK